MTRKLQIALFGLFTLAALGLSFLLTFPWETVGRRLEYEAVRALPGASIAIGETGPALPLGIALGDITLRLPPPAPGKTGPVLSVEKVRLKPMLFALLGGKPGATVDVRAFGGAVKGSVKKRSEGFALTLDAQNVQLDEGKLLQELAGVDIRGVLTAKAQLMLDAQGTISDGALEASIENALYAGGKVSGFTVPALDLGSPELNVSVQDGKATIHTLTIKSADVDASLEEGVLLLRPQFAQSLIKGQARAKLSDGWLEKAKLRSLIGLVPASIRKPDGTFEIALNGPLTKPATLPRVGF